MSRILEKLYLSMALGAVLALVIIVWYHGYRVAMPIIGHRSFTFLHVLSAITWIGLLYYFNLGANADDAENAGRSETGRQQIHSTGGVVLVSLAARFRPSLPVIVAT